MAPIKWSIFAHDKDRRLMKTCLISILLFLSSVAAAQDIAGMWHGELNLPAGTLRLVFHIECREAGMYVSTLDSPDQGVAGIRTASTTFRDSLLEIRIPAINALYRGKYGKGDSITGTFTQGMPFALCLKKGEQFAVNRPQEPKPPFPYRVEEVWVMNGKAGIRLAGTLTLPAEGGPFPAVVMLTGSGPHNRDEEMMGHKPFLVIADHLTRHGIAVLRCDDRGTASSEGDFATATNRDFVTDTEAMLDYLRGRREIDSNRVGIVGHSCGGTVALRAAASHPSVAFVVSLAGAGVRGDSLMLKQVEAISKSQGTTEPQWEQAKPVLRRRYALLLQADKTPEQLRRELYEEVTAVMPAGQFDDPAVAQRLAAELHSMTSPWYLEFMRHDPAEDMKRVKCPVLVLNGEQDVQVDAETNLHAIRTAIESNGNTRVTTKSYPGLNHLFQTCRRGTLDEYGELEETISPEVLADITEWILEQ